ncbi:unnamed protein product [Symbiodinium sp. CCMP2592]|nr:unnamed protein product [Symbiodinium sp. CCMP2592]
MDNLETQQWLPSPEDLVHAWGEMEKKEAELRNRENALAEQERAQRTLRSQEKLRQQLRDQEARRLRAVEASRAGESLPADAKPAAKVITRQMQMGLVAEKKSKPTEEEEEEAYEDAAESSAGVKPKSKAKAKAKGKAKAKAKGKAKAKTSKVLACASVGPSESEREELDPEPEELEAPPEDDEDLGEAPPAELPKLRRSGGKIGRSKSRKLLLRGRKKVSPSKASKTRAGKKKAGKRGDGSAHEIEYEEEQGMEDATQRYEDDEDWDALGGDENTWIGATGKRKAEKSVLRRVRNKAKAAENAEPAPASEKADEDEMEEPSEAEPEEDGDEEGRKTFARRPRPTTRPINMARFDAIRDAYTAKIRIFVTGHSKLEDF